VQDDQLGNGRSSHFPDRGTEFYEIALFVAATPATVQPYFDGIPDVRWEVLEHSSHMPFLEEPDRLDEVVSDFLAAND